MLRCRDLELRAGERVLCRGLTLELGRGEVWAVLGRNGTGKSTFMHVLAGLTQPASGTAELENQPVGRWPARERAHRLGVLLQIEDSAYWGTVLDYVLLGRFPHARPFAGFAAADRDHALAALNEVGMSEHEARSYGSLSGGERQRVRIAQILAQRPAAYLLDEPLQHLDLAHQGRVLSIVAERARSGGALAVMVLHEPLWIGRACTHALLFAGDGSIQAGPVDSVLTRERLEAAYGCGLREVAHGEGRCFVPNV